MKLQKCTLIISVYKDIESLDLILSSVNNQSVKPDEVVISEDCSSAEMSDYLKKATDKYQALELVHLFQEDIGWRKNRALNRAVSASKFEYLIFIDGDCVPYTNFVEWHLKLSSLNSVICGRRTEPGNKVSKKLKDRVLSIEQFSNSYIRLFLELKKDDVRHYDEGLFINPFSYIGKKLKEKRDKKSHLVGCNFSCYKSDLEKINGFDEDFTLPTTGEDTDIERRMKHFGIEMKSCRNAANLIHLYHKKVFNLEITSQTEALMSSKSDIFVCSNGIKKLKN